MYRLDLWPSPYFRSHCRRGESGPPGCDRCFTPSLVCSDCRVSPESGCIPEPQLQRRIQNCPPFERLLPVANHRDLRSGSNPHSSRRHRHMSAPRYRAATAPRTGCGHELSHGPAVRVCDAARLGESVQSRRWRSGFVRPSDPARGCRDWLAGLAAKRAAPCSAACGTCRNDDNLLLSRRPPSRPGAHEDPRVGPARPGSGRAEPEMTRTDSEARARRRDLLGPCDGEALAMHAESILACAPLV
jgi:hypothetical protein